MSARSSAASHPLIFRQLFEKVSSTYTYLLADPRTKIAVLIDPVLETVERDLKIIKELDLTLKYAINTHVHADHVTGSGKIKQTIEGVKSVLSVKSNAKADVFVKDGDFLEFGARKLEFRETPGKSLEESSVITLRQT